MAIDKEDLDYLRKYLKDYFVTRQECDTITDDLEKKLANDSTRLAVIEHQLKNITWILTAVGGGVITMLIKMFWGA